MAFKHKAFKQLKRHQQGWFSLPKHELQHTSQLGEVWLLWPALGTINLHHLIVMHSSHYKCFWGSAKLQGQQSDSILCSWLRTGEWYESVNPWALLSDANLIIIIKKDFWDCTSTENDSFNYISEHIVLKPHKEIAPCRQTTNIYFIFLHYYLYKKNLNTVFEPCFVNLA